MGSVFNDPEIPDILHYMSISGIVLLGISCILFFVFYFNNHQVHDHEKNTNISVPASQKNMEIAWMVTGAVGYLMCFGILIGHYIKSKSDPKTVVGFNSVYHELGENLLKVDTNLEPSQYANTRVGIPKERFPIKGDFLN
jgi:hypothetical protein